MTCGARTEVNRPTGLSVRDEPIHGETIQGKPARGEPVHGEPIHGETIQGKPVRGEPVGFHKLSVDRRIDLPRCRGYDAAYRATPVSEGGA